MKTLSFFETKPDFQPNPSRSTQTIRIEWARYFVCEKILSANAQFDRHLNCWRNDVSARRRKNAKHEVQRILYAVSNYLRTLNLETLASTVSLVQRICESTTDSPDTEQYKNLKQVIPSVLLYLQNKEADTQSEKIFDIASDACWIATYPKHEVEANLARFHAWRGMISN